MVRRILKLSGVAIAGALLLLSCYFAPTGTTGSIQFTVDRVLAKNIADGATTLRVSLYVVAQSGTQNALYTFPGGATYQSFTIAGATTVTLSDIPVGTYVLLLAAGATDSSGNFIVASYGHSSRLSVAPGVDNAASVTLAASPFTNLVAGQSMVGVVSVGSPAATYAATAGSVYSVSGSTVSAAIGVPSGSTVNSVSPGLLVAAAATTPDNALFVNTNQGILPLKVGSTTFDSVSSSFAASMKTTSGDTITVRQSGALPVGNDVAVFYQRSGGFGGAWIPQTTYGTQDYSNLAWVDIDLSGKVTGRPIYDFTVTQNAGYFASKLGAFRADQALVQQSSSTPDFLAFAKFFTVPDDSTIISLAASSDDSHLYIGTTLGAWIAPLQEADPNNPIGAPTTVSKIPTGDSIFQIATSASGEVAFLSRYNLYIQNGSTVTAYPFYSGLPGTLSGMAWNGSALYVAGSTGLVSITP